MRIIKGIYNFIPPLLSSGPFPPQRSPMADPGISKHGARSRGGRIFRSGVCFDAPSHMPYMFAARLVNKIHNINIVYFLKSKYILVIQSKFTKTNPYFFSKGGGGRPARRSWIRLCSPRLHKLREIRYMQQYVDSLRNISYI